MEAVLAGLFGLLIGSFLNVCIYRMPRDLSVVKPRSHCPGCKQPIAFYDNIPLLSYLLLRGKCRHCAAHISLRYPLVEALTGLLFYLVIRVFGANPAGMKYCIFSAIQVALLFTDLEERILPDEFTLGGMFAGFGLAGLTPAPGDVLSLFTSDGLNWRLRSVGESVLSGGVLSGTLWSIGALYQKIRHREGLGFGDVKMAGTIGAFLGMGGALFAIIAGSVLGSVCGLCFIWLTGKDSKTYELPFGSFLAIGALLAMFQTAALFGGGSALELP